MISHLLNYSFVTSEKKFSKQVLKLIKEINFYDLDIKKNFNDLDASIELITNITKKKFD